MLSFDEQLAAADTAITEHLGTSGCSYKGADGEVPDMHMIIEKDVQVIKEDGYTSVRQTHASFAKLNFDINSDDLITCSGSAYRVVEVISDDGSMVTVSLIRRG